MAFPGGALVVPFCGGQRACDTGTKRSSGGSSTGKSFWSGKWTARTRPGESHL
jgi:hypothetical protein